MPILLKSEDFDQTGRIPRLHLLFAGRTDPLFAVLVEGTCSDFLNSRHATINRGSHTSGQKSVENEWFLMEQWA